MKPIIQKLWMAMAMLCFSISASAYDFEVDGIRYNVLSHVDFTVETTFSPDVTIGEDGILSIPESVNYGSKALKVVQIGDRSFISNRDIKEVYLPNCAELIGEYAFSNCEFLHSLSAEKIRIVSPHAFEGCIELSQLSLGDDISEVKEYSFALCTSLTKLQFDKNIQIIGANAFMNCGLEYFLFSEKDLTIGEYAFNGCKNLKTVEFKDDTFNLANGMFKDCENLRNLINFTVPAIIPSFCFQNCKHLNIANLLQSSALETISSYSLSGCMYPETIILKSSIRNIEDCVFEGFDGNLEIDDSYIPLNVTKQSFSGMNIVRLRLGRNLSSWNFHFSSPLISLNIGPCVSEIAPKIEVAPGNSYYSGYTYGGAPFVECTNLESIEIEATSAPLFISGIGKQIDYTHTGGDYKDWYYSYSFSGVFSECPIKNLKIMRPITTDNGTQYTFKRSNKYYDYTTYKWQDPFHGVTSVSSLMVDYNAFDYSPITSTLKELSVDFYVSHIPDLSICEIENINVRTPFPPTAAGFSSKTYMNCSLNIPPGEQKEYQSTEIWSSFWNISEASSLLCCIKNNGLLYHILENNQLALIKDKILYAGEIALPSEITFDGNSYLVCGIEKNAFRDCSQLNSLKISGSVTQFGDSIFTGCTSLHSLHFDDSENLLSFPIGSFDHTSSTQTKTIDGKTVRFAISYYYGFFNGLPLTELYIGRNLCNDNRYHISYDGYRYLITSYDTPFSNLPNLTELTIGENVSTIGPLEAFIDEVGLAVTPGSFKKCSSLKEIEVKNSTPPAGAEFSTAAYSNATLIVPDNTVSLFQVADGWKEFINILDETSVGIEPITIAKNSPISVSIDGIIYEGDYDVSILICGIDGKYQYSGNISSGQFIALSKGIYIVTIDGQSMKIKI